MAVFAGWMQGWAGAGAALLLMGCGGGQRGQDPLRATGEVIAFSGGDGGARNACFTCHGVDGAGDGQATPRLAGVSRGYLLKQLQDYASGRRDDAVMTPIAKRLHAEDRRKVAAFYEALPVSPPRPGAWSAAAEALYQRGDPTRELAACADCHGTTGVGDAANPPLAGQPAAYLAGQLARWARAERRNDPRGVMLAISRRLTASEIAAVSAYAAGLGAGSPPAP